MKNNHGGENEVIEDSPTLPELDGVGRESRMAAASMRKVYCNSIAVTPEKPSCECALDLWGLAGFVYLWKCPTQAKDGLDWATFELPHSSQRWA